MKQDRGNLLYGNRGKLHRREPNRAESLPEFDDGCTIYKRSNGEIHRSDGPAILISEHGERLIGNYLVAGPAEVYLENGKPSADGPTVVGGLVTQSGDLGPFQSQEHEPISLKELWLDQNYQPHCEDGPALTRTDGGVIYSLHGQPHREDGPAVLAPEDVKLHLGIYQIEGPAEIYLENGEPKLDRPTIVGGKITVGELDGPNISVKELWLEKTGLIHREGGPAIIHSDGSLSYLYRSQSHRDDGPSFVGADGSEEWYRNGKVHREDGPAIIGPDGDQEWYCNDELHREDGPAIIGADGTQMWYEHGKQHRDGAPASISPDGQEEWRQHGLLHREDGPASRGATGTNYWFQEGELHREDGPAVEGKDGFEEWWLNGEPHRENEPACIAADRSKLEYWREGKLHRQDGPAVVLTEGGVFNSARVWESVSSADEAMVFCDLGLGRISGPAELWFEDGKLHRSDGPAITYADGTKEWWIRGRRHRQGAASVVVAKGARWNNWQPVGHMSSRKRMPLTGPAELYYSHGQLHNVSGPALRAQGRRDQYWLEGEKLTNHQWQKQAEPLRRELDLQEKLATGQLNTARVWVEIQSNQEHLVLGEGHEEPFPQRMIALAAELTRKSQLMHDLIERDWRVAIERHFDQNKRLYALTKEFASQDQASEEVIAAGGTDSDLEWGIRDRHIELGDYQTKRDRGNDLRERLGIYQVGVRVAWDGEAVAALEEQADTGLAEAKNIWEQVDDHQLLICRLELYAELLPTTPLWRRDNPYDRRRGKIVILDTIDSQCLYFNDDGANFAQRATQVALGGSDDWSRFTEGLASIGIEATREDLLDLGLKCELAEDDEEIELRVSGDFVGSWPPLQMYLG